MCNRWAARVKLNSSAKTMTACRCRNSTLGNTAPSLFRQTAEIGNCPTSSEGTGRGEKVSKRFFYFWATLPRPGGLQFRRRDTMGSGRGEKCTRAKNIPSLFQSKDEPGEAPGTVVEEAPFRGRF